MAKGGWEADVLGEATEELYGADPADFVAARNDLVRRLKSDGRRDLAAEVAKLRRPTPAAWAVNQLSRRDLRGLEELVTRGEELRAAQDRALAGAHADEMRDKSRARRDAVAALADEAAGFLAERGVSPDAHRGQIIATLEAASLGTEAAAAVLGGRLSAPLEPPSGFGDLEGALAASTAALRSGTQPGPARSPRAASESPDSDARAAAEARRLARGLATQARSLRERVSGRRRQLEEAEAEVAALERRLAEARGRRDEAAEATREAEEAASRAEAAAAEAATAAARLDEAPS